LSTRCGFYAEDLVRFEVVNFQGGWLASGDDTTQFVGSRLLHHHWFTCTLYQTRTIGILNLWFNEEQSLIGPAEHNLN
jgi:hypothetical protein